MKRAVLLLASACAPPPAAPVNLAAACAAVGAPVDGEGCRWSAGDPWSLGAWTADGVVVVQTVGWAHLEGARDDADVAFLLTQMALLNHEVRGAKLEMDAGTGAVELRAEVPDRSPAEVVSEAAARVTALARALRPRLLPER